MRIKHNDIIIDEKEPFANCQLDRLQYADTLTNIVKNYAEGFVLAINSEWGTGKTTFVKMWKQQLQNAEFQTLYFNAWENDFEINPLIAFLAELKKLVKKDSAEFKKLLSKGAVIVKNIAPVLVKAVVDKYINTELIKEGLVEVSKGVADVLEDEIKEYSKKKDGIKEFKESLEKFLKKLNSDKPLIFIIDELDRCRPNYAVELLEQIKHFFSVSGIVFVLAIDKEQLGYAVRGVYGSEGLNATEYLRRFIDIEYTIPDPYTETFVRYLYNYFQLDKFFASSDRRKYQEFVYDEEYFIDFATILFENSKVNLRQQEKIFAQIRLTLDISRANQYIFPSLLITLIYLKHLVPSFYKELRNKAFTIAEIPKGLKTHLPKPTNDKQSRMFVQLEAMFVFFYSYNVNPDFKLLIADKNTNVITATIQSVFDDTGDKYEFRTAIERLQQTVDHRLLTLDYFFKKIDLIQNAKL